MAFSSTKATQILNQEFVNVTCYLALYTTNPTPNDTGAEVAGNAYARQEIEFTAPSAEGGAITIKNAAEIRFPVATGNWGTITHVGIRSAATGGNLIAFGELTNPRSILTGDRFTIDLNSGTVRLI